MGTYYEPFIGGGAVFFALAAESPRRFDRAVIGDYSRDIAEMYEAIRDDVDGLIAALSVHVEKHSEAHYYETRNVGPLFRGTWSKARRAARTIYGIRAGFNGLRRENRLGENNVSWNHEDTVTFDYDNLRACSAALVGVEIRCGDFATTLRDAQAGDLAYLDPVYLYDDDADNFTGYNGAGSFTRRDHARLADLCVEIGDRGVSVLLSNDDNPAVREVYHRLYLETVEARRNVNRDGDGRGPVPEILARYPHPPAGSSH